MNSRESKEGAAGKARVAGLVHELPVWAHYVWLIYLGFLFTPLFSPDQHGRVWLWATLVSLPVFLFLYVRVLRAFRDRDSPGPEAFYALMAMMLLAYALVPLNGSANSYVIYCAAVSPLALPSVRRLAAFVGLLLFGYAIELSVLNFRPLLFAITAVISILGALGNFLMAENRRKNVALQLSREEVHRMARLAERERIGRDLHDLLGHTLSLIAIKSELAAKLLDRDRPAAAREVTEVMNIAREALKQVRTAVAGIRAAALENEIASARALLSTAGMTLTFERDGAVLPAEIETALAMIVREAVTNIQRHSGARQARIEVVTQAAGEPGENVKGRDRLVFLTVSDDGRGGVTAAGNGLSGIGERVRSLGGTLQIESPRGKGTTLRVRLPVAALVVDRRGLTIPGAGRAPALSPVGNERGIVDAPAAEGAAGGRGVDALVGGGAAGVRLFEAPVGGGAVGVRAFEAPAGGGAAGVGAFEAPAGGGAAGVRAFEAPVGGGAAGVRDVDAPAGGSAAGGGDGRGEIGRELAGMVRT